MDIDPSLTLTNFIIKRENSADDGATNRISLAKNNFLYIDIFYSETYPIILH